MAVGACLAPIATASADQLAYAPYPVTATTNLKIANADGTNVREIPNTGRGTAPSMSPDGKMVAYVQKDSTGYDQGVIYVINVDGTGKHLVVASTASAPAWSPGGDVIAYTSGGAGPEADIGLATPDNSSHFSAIAWPGRQQRPAWGPDNKTLVFQTDHDSNGVSMCCFDSPGGDIWRANRDGSSPQPISRPTLDVCSGWAGNWPTVSKDWKVAWAEGGVVCVEDISDTGGSPVVSDTQPETPKFSADGTKLLYVNWPPGGTPPASVCPAVKFALGGSGSWAPTGCVSTANYQVFDLRTYFRSLLPVYAPILKYNSGEPYFADSAQEATDWTDGTVYGEPLENASNAVFAGAALASTKSKPCQHLTLTLLGPTYLGPSGTACGSRDFYISRPSGAFQSGDHLDIPGSSANPTYSTDYSRLTATHPEWLDTYYGKAAVGVDGRVYLEYWFWYYYNSEQRFGFGLHEGDWENVQIGFDGLAPANVTYSQHKGHSFCPWDQTEHNGSVLNVYVAKDSHASYAYSGATTRGGGLLPTDLHYGDNSHATYGSRLIDVTSNPGWASWPGLWGASTSSTDAEQASPQGPGLHAQWSTPDSIAVPTGTDECLPPPIGTAASKHRRRRVRAQSTRHLGPAPQVAGRVLASQKMSIRYTVRDWERYHRVTRLSLRVTIYRNDSPVPVVRVVRVVKQRGRFEMGRPYGGRRFRVEAQLFNRRAEPVSRISRSDVR